MAQERMDFTGTSSLQAYTYHHAVDGSEPIMIRLCDLFLALIYNND